LQRTRRCARRAEHLATEPRIDRHVPEYPEDDLREVLERPYRLFFHAGPSRIDILTIKHYRQRPPARAADL